MSISATYQLRQILKNKSITPFLLKIDPTNYYLKFENSSTSSYQEIVSWCNIKKDLKQDKHGIWKTHNGLFYDPLKDAFVELNYDYIKTVHIEDVIALVLSELRCSDMMLGESSWFEFIDEKYITPSIIELLEKEGYVSKAINIPINLIGEK